MKKIDNIIKESINNLILEEIGVITDLEPFGDFIVDQFYNTMFDNFRSNKDEVFELSFSMDYIKRAVSCKNWYGIDNAEKIILKTEVDEKSGNLANIQVENDEGPIVPIITINLAYGFTKDSIYMGVLSGTKWGTIRKYFYRTYTASVMHELTHLIEIVKTWGKHQYPSYAWLSDYKDVMNAAFAFSKTEINARVTTLYYSIVRDKELVDVVNAYNGDRASLARYLIAKNNGMNWIKGMLTCMERFRRGIKNGFYEDIMFIREFIDLNRNTAFLGSKNVFKIKWKNVPGDKDSLSNWNDSDDNVIRMGTKIYNQMVKMYNTYIKKMYGAANLAIDNIKNAQTKRA